MRVRRAQVPGMRKWLKFERSGRTEILQVDKHAIALQTGVQVWWRDALALLHVDTPANIHSGQQTEP